MHLSILLLAAGLKNEIFLSGYLIFIMQKSQQNHKDNVGFEICKDNFSMQLDDCKLLTKL